MDRLDPEDLTGTPAAAIYEGLCRPIQESFRSRVLFFKPSAFQQREKAFSRFAEDFFPLVNIYSGIALIWISALNPEDLFVENSPNHLL